MKKKLKAWIFCRVAPHSPTSLLTFQKEQLEEIAEACNMEVVGTTQVISDGKWLNGFEIKSLLIQIRRKKFDILLINSPYRISIYPDVYEEFEMICRLYNVKVLLIWTTLANSFRVS